MKEATGELNITVITVIAVAGVSALFYAFIWPMIKNSLEANAKCAAAYNCNENGQNCSYYNTDNNKTETGLDCSGYR